jgi:uncharacterized membrane protein
MYNFPKYYLRKKTKMKRVGIFIIMLGLALTFFTAFTLFTKEKVVDLGAIEITKNKAHHLNWSPLVGIGVMAIGGVIVWQSSKR